MTCSGKPSSQSVASASISEPVLASEPFETAGRPLPGELAKRGAVPDLDVLEGSRPSFQGDFEASHSIGRPCQRPDVPVEQPRVRPTQDPPDFSSATASASSTTWPVQVSAFCMASRMAAST